MAASRGNHSIFDNLDTRDGLGSLHSSQAQVERSLLFFSQAARSNVPLVQRYDVYISIRFRSCKLPLSSQRFGIFPLEARLGRCCLLSLFVHSSELGRAFARTLQKKKSCQPHVRYEGLASSANLGAIFSFVIGSGFFTRFYS